MANFPSLVEFFMPIALEFEIDKFSNSRGNYSLFSKADDSLSSSLITQLGSYMVGPMPVGVLEPRDDFYDFPESIRNVLEHPKQGTLFSNILLKSNITEPIKMANGSNFFPEINLMAIPCIYLFVDRGVITDVSPVLRRDLEVYFNRNFKYRGQTFENCLRLLSPQELFCSNADRDGVQGVFITRMISGWRSSRKRVTVSNFYKGYKIPDLDGTGWVYLESTDYNIVNVDVFLGNKGLAYQEVKEGASKVEQAVASSSTQDSSAQITSKNSGGRITGTASPREVVIISYGVFTGMSEVATANDEGVWSINRPSYMVEDSLITVRSGIKAGSGSSSSISEVKEGVAQKKHDIPVLVPFFSNEKVGMPPYRYKGDAISGVRAPFLEITCDPTKPHSRLDSSSKKGEIKDYLVMSVGIEPEQKRKGVFVSFPGGAVRSTGISCFCTESWAADAHTYKKVHYQGESFRTITLYEIRLGLESPMFYGTQLISSYNTHYPEKSSLKINIPFQKNFEDKRFKLTTRFKKGVTKQTRHLTFKTKWTLNRPKKHKIRLYTKFRSNLPEKQVGRAFYVFRYTSKQPRYYNLKLQTSFKASYSKVNNKTIKTSFNVTPVEPVKVIPYYIRQNVNGKWEHLISFSVFGLVSEIQNYILDNQFYFYFSNPTSFEIIKFDYNMLPYSNIIMTSLSDEVLKEDENSSVGFSFIGNYTIKGINTKNSLSLDIVGRDRQLNEARSYWLPENIEDIPVEDMIPLSNDRYALKLNNDFRDNHHEDIVELDLIILNERECCFTQKASGSRCSPY